MASNGNGNSKGSAGTVTDADAQKQLQKYRRKADKYKNNPKKANEVVRKAVAKADRRGGPLAELHNELRLMMRMVQAYYRREYTRVPWETIATVLGALLYLLSPADLIPDFIPVIGLVDDALVLSLVIRSFRAQIEDFRTWLEEQGVELEEPQQ